MKKNNFAKKKIMNKYIILFIFILLILISLVLMLKYTIEGETNLPFNLEKITVISTAESKLTQDADDVWHAAILQENNFYFEIEKNEKYNKQETIKAIKFENFEIEKGNEELSINIYSPSTDVNTYDYCEDCKIENTVEYTGGLSTNTEAMQINNQGGIIGFSIAVDNIGEYNFAENEKLPSDGTLIAKAGISEENIKFKVSFDMIIETDSGHKYKATLKYDLPTGEITKDGVVKIEDTELKNVVFKRF